MRKTTVAIVGLSVALAASNTYWLYRMVDAGVSYTYLQDSYRDAQSTARQALALLPVAAQANSSKDALVSVVARFDPTSAPFDKDGFTWVGSLGLKFDASGRLIEARSDIEPL